MFEQMTQIKSISDSIINIYENKHLDLAKTQPANVEKAINEVLVLGRSCEKTNEALWVTVERLKEIESVLDVRLNQKKSNSPLESRVNS